MRDDRARSDDTLHTGWRRTSRRLFGGILTGIFLVNGLPCSSRGAEPLKVIFDTDIDGDNDDVAAASILHALADQGRLEILAMGVVSRHEYSPACLDAINTYYGRGDIPIGVYKGSDLAVQGSSYAKVVAERCANDIGGADEVPNVLDVYRRVLAAQPDGTVTMIAVGQMNNLVDLLASPADQHSPLAGDELARRKIRTLFVMAPYFNEQNEYQRAYNFVSSPKAAVKLTESWPTPIRFGEGNLGHRHFIGSRLTEAPPENPTRIAFEAYFAVNNRDLGRSSRRDSRTGQLERHCADPTTVLYAVGGAEYFGEVGPGACDVREDGHTRWNAARDKQHYYNTQKRPIEELEDVMEELVLAPPKSRAVAQATPAARRIDRDAATSSPRPQGVLRPEIDGPWWTVAHNPDLGPLSSPEQEPVDFAVWQAADGSWQICSCIRKTNCGGRTRLFFRWEGRNLTDADWEPRGIAMQAEEKFGEMIGGLQAPHVVNVGDKYVMTYGDSEHICLAESHDGKHFERIVQPNGTTGLFAEGTGNRTRDAMLLRIGDLWHCYYTAYPNAEGSVYCRVSPDFSDWSDSRKVAFGGQAGTSSWSAECPFVVALGDRYYLFRTQRYGADAVTTIYHSTDPLDFGLDNDQEHLVGTLPVAAPEIVLHEGRYYLAALLPDLTGIQVANLTWVAE